MYTFSGKLKTFSIILMALGIMGIAYGFLTAPKTIEEVEVILSEQHHDGHGSHDTHAATTHDDSHGDAADAKASHDEHTKHLEHVLHQLQNKPWAAVYVGCI